MRKHYKSRFPALNVQRRQEPVATDTIFSKTPAVDSGVTAAQLFIGKHSLVSDIYPLKSTSQFVNTLEDMIRARGAMSELISDYAQCEISNKVVDILRMYNISNWHSEPYHQHQNPAERRWCTIQAWTNTILNRTGAPKNCWLLCILHVCYLLNHISSAALDGHTPLYKLTGQKPDISALLLFHFYQRIFYSTLDKHFPDSEERAGYWVGVAENIGDALTFKILDAKTHKIINRSSVRPDTVHNPNKRAAIAFPSEDGESDFIPHKENLATPDLQEQYKDKTAKEQFKHVFSRSDEDPESSSHVKPMPEFDPSDLIGRTFLKPVNEKGNKYRARVADIIYEETDDHAKRINIMLEVGEEKSQEIISYNKLLDFIEQDDFANDLSNDGLFQYRDIIGHQGPLQPTDPDYKGSTYNVQVEWETGEISYVPLNLIGTDDPVTCAAYAKKKGLLNTPGWKKFKRYAKTEKRLIRAMKQNKLRQARHSVKYMFGYQIPRNWEEALYLDKKNGNSKWFDARQLEVDQLHEYNTFIDKGIAQKDKKGSILNAPEGFHKINVQVVYAVKHDGRHKVRIVAGGHLTPDPVESVYSGVVSHKSLRLVVFLSQLNRLQLWGADVGNAYLEAYTREKVYIVAGKIFGDLEGHILIISKALYGLKTSGKMWHERFADILKNLGFHQSRADPCVWLRQLKDKSGYEYIAVYVDDLAMASPRPENIVHDLETKYHLKLKGVGKLEYHLGCDYYHDKDGNMVYSPQKYINKMEDSYKIMFGEKPPNKHKTPLDKNDHPEVDTSEFLNDDGIDKYMTLIGQLQWLISLGRFDTMVQIITMSRFRLAPRIGHLNRVKRIIGYVVKTKNYGIRVRTEEPDVSGLPDLNYDWTNTVYGDIKEEIPKDIPEPLGKPVVLTTYLDANLLHCLATGRALSSVLHVVNGTPFEWFSKRQQTVETATYGSEFVVARTAVEQILEHRQLLRYLGVPIKGPTHMFGDNRAVVTSATVPHSVLSRRMLLLAYHKVRENMAAKIVTFHWVDGHLNFSDIMSKHWEWAAVGHHIVNIFERQGKLVIIPISALSPMKGE